VLDPVPAGWPAYLAGSLGQRRQLHRTAAPECACPNLPRAGQRWERDQRLGGPTRPQPIGPGSDQRELDQFGVAGVPGRAGPLSIAGADRSARLAEPGPASRTRSRWPLVCGCGAAEEQNTPLVLNVSYQNGVLSEWRQITWKPLNLLAGGDLTLRKGDSLLLTVRPPGAPATNMVITIGTNQLPVWQVP